VTSEFRPRRRQLPQPLPRNRLQIAAATTAEHAQFYTLSRLGKMQPEINIGLISVTCMDNTVFRHGRELLKGSVAEQRNSDNQSFEKTRKKIMHYTAQINHKI